MLKRIEHQMDIYHYEIKTLFPGLLISVVARPGRN